MANEINYTNTEFEEIRLSLLNKLASQSTLKDGAYRSSTIAMLVELMAAVGTIVNHYIQRRAEESYIETAKNRSSVINLVRLLNYNPRRAVSSSGILRFNIAGPVTESIYIPKWTECQSTAGVKFLVSTGGVILPGQTQVDLDAIQGELVTVSFTSTGLANQEFNINDTTVENTNYQVTVTGAVTEQWDKVDSFINSVTSSKHFKVKPELNDTLTFVFGDGVNGLIPATGSVISVSYVKSVGSLGNVYNIGSINTVNDIIYNASAQVQSVNVTNTGLFLGGEDIETTEEIKYNAPRVFATGDRAVTKDDFVALLEDYPGVANVNIWGEAEETNPDANNYNRIKICMLLQNWGLSDSAFRSAISTYLYLKSLITVRYSFVDPIIVDVVPTLTVKANKNFSLSSVQSAIEESLGNQFILGSTTRLGTSVRLANIYDIVQSCSGVSYSYIDLKIRKVLNAGEFSNYDYGCTLDVLGVLAGSAEIYINDTKVATDGGSGTFVDVGGDGYTVSGSIDYSTGVVGIDISESLELTDVVSIRYKQVGQGDITVTKDQICKLYDIVFSGLTYIS